MKELIEDTMIIMNHNRVDHFPKIERYIKENQLPIQVVYGAKVDMIVHQVSIPVTIFIRNQIGLKNLYQIISLIKTKNLIHEKKQVITKKEMLSHCAGLLYGLNLLDMLELYDQMNDDAIEQDMMWYDFILIDSSKYQEMNDQQEQINHLIELAKKYRKMIIATKTEKQETIFPDIAYMDKDLTNELDLTNLSRLTSLMNPIEIIKDKVYFPKIQNSKEIFLKQIDESAHRLYGKKLPKVVENRIQEELYGQSKEQNSGIIPSEYESIYLIYQELVQKSNQLGYPVLPRGYVGSSFLAYLLGITKINPLESHYHCLNCGYNEFHDEKNQPYSQKYPYGIDMPNKKCKHCHTVMKQDGFNLSYQMFLGYNAKNKPNIYLNIASAIQKDLQQDLEKQFGHQNVIHAGVMSPTKNVWGILPGSLFIVPKEMDIHDFTPIAYPCDDPKYQHIITHLDYQDIKHHLMKLNFLAHPALDKMKKLEERTHVRVSSIPLNDQEIYQWLISGETNDLLSLSKPLVKKLLQERKPTTFKELMNIVGWLYNEEEDKDFSSEIIYKEDLYEYFLQKKLPEEIAYSLTKFISSGEVMKKPKIWQEYQSILKKYNIDQQLMERFPKIHYLVTKSHCISYAIFDIQLSWYQIHFPNIFEEVMHEFL